MATERQIIANQLNALRSTGPKTDSGKLASRKNAITHGLSGFGIVVKDAEAEAILDRKLSWGRTIGPRNEYESWLVEQLAVESIRIDRCQETERGLRARLAERARTCWDDDRRVAAEGLLPGLTLRPAVVRRQLEATAQGCEALIERWTGLEQAMDRPESWTEVERARALDLLGVPTECRLGSSPLAQAPEELRHLIAREVDRLRTLKSASRDRLDAEDARLASLGTEVEPDRALILVRRYEAGCRRRMEGALKQLKELRGNQPIEAVSFPTMSRPIMAEPFDAVFSKPPGLAARPAGEPPLEADAIDFEEELEEPTDPSTLEPTNHIVANPRDAAPLMNRRRRRAQLALARRN